MVRNAIALLSNKNKLKWGTGLERNYKFDFAFVKKYKIKFIKVKELKMEEEFVEIDEHYESDQEYEDENEEVGSFFESETPKNNVSLRNTQREQEQDSFKEDKKYLKIEIDSIDKLIGSLRFTTANFEKAMDRVESNNDLKAVLQELQKISKQDFDFLKDVDIAKRVQAQIDRVDTNSITKKINEKMSVSLKTLDTTAEKIKKYSDAFNDEEVISTLDKIERVEHFTSNFKFKSIVFSSIFGFIAAFFVTYFVAQFLFEPQKSTSSNPELTAFFQKIEKLDIKVVQDEKLMQLWLPKTEKIKIGEDESKKSNIIQIRK